MRIHRFALPVFVAAACAVPGPAGRDGQPGARGGSCTSVASDGGTSVTCEPGPTSTGCSVRRHDGGATISCPDGTSATVSDGQTGAPGTPGASCVQVRDDAGTGVECEPGAAGTRGNSCSVERHEGGATITCEDGTVATVGDGQNGAAGNSCTIVHHDAGATITCQDGTTTEVRDGMRGDSCTVVHFDGGATITCEDGTSATVTEPGETCAVVYGDISLHTKAEFDTFARLPCVDIIGNLAVDAPDLREATFPGLRSVSGTVNFSGAALTRVWARALTGIGSNLFIGGAPLLTQLDFPRVESVQSLTITGTGLSHLDGLSGLTSAGSIVIGESPALVDLEGLRRVLHLENRLYLHAIGASDLNAFSGLTAVGGGVEILNCASLQDIHGLQNISLISGQLKISGNPMVGSIDGFSNLEHIGGDLEISSNDTLTVVAFVGLAAVGGTLRILDNASLPGFSAPELATIGALNLSGAVLTQMALPVLTHIERQAIIQNTGLTDLGFLGHVTHADELIIKNNAALPQCAALGLRDRLLALMPRGLTGSATIEGNNTAATCQ